MRYPSNALPQYGGQEPETKIVVGLDRFRGKRHVAWPSRVAAICTRLVFFGTQASTGMSCARFYTSLDRLRLCLFSPPLALFFFNSWSRAYPADLGAER